MMKFTYLVNVLTTVILYLLGGQLDNPHHPQRKTGTFHTVRVDHSEFTDYTATVQDGVCLACHFLPRHSAHKTHSHKTHSRIKLPIILTT